MATIYSTLPLLRENLHPCTFRRVLSLIGLSLNDAPYMSTLRCNSALRHDWLSREAQ